MTSGIIALSAVLEILVYNNDIISLSGHFATTYSKQKSVEYQEMIHFDSNC